jgi:23S rRNA pseudouridine1911/1915/1917 synthase
MEFSIRLNPSVSFTVRLAEDDFLVVDKPAGVVTQPGKKHEHDSLLNGLFVDYGRQLQNVGASRDWGLLHRLDRDTSGLVLVALRLRAWEHLFEQFKARQVRKVYWAIVCGRPTPAQGVIQKPILEVAGARKRAVVHRDGQQAITAYRVLQAVAEASLIEARPKTGRLHQIRVHLADRGHPVLGDDTYGGGQAGTPRRGSSLHVPRLCLHAAALSFVHPAGDRRVTVASEWPDDLRGVLRKLGLNEPTMAAAPDPAGGGRTHEAFQARRRADD